MTHSYENVNNLSKFSLFIDKSKFYSGGNKNSTLIRISMLLFNTNTFNPSILNLNCAIRLPRMVSYIKGGTQAKVISKQDLESNIWA